MIKPNNPITAATITISMAGLRGPATGRMAMAPRPSPTTMRRFGMAGDLAPGRGVGRAIAAGYSTRRSTYQAANPTSAAAATKKIPVSAS